MSKEIEKKYVIREDGTYFITEIVLQMYPSIQALQNDVLQNGNTIIQGYLPLDAGTELSDTLGMPVDFTPGEARLRDKSGTLYFTLKSIGGLFRNELEVSLDQPTFDNYWPKTKGKRVKKVRLCKSFEEYTVEIDVFTDRDLILIEVEVPTIEQAANLSDLGRDVTTDQAYKNKNLAK